MIDKDKVMVLIDASNIHYSKDTLGGWLNLWKITNFFKRRHNSEIVTVFYYSAYPKQGTRKDETLNNLHKFFTKLEKWFNFIVRKKALKSITDCNGKVVEKGNMDIEMTIDMMRRLGDYDIFILFTGDSDFLPVIKEIRSEWKKVYIYSTKWAVSSELRTGWDGYFDIRNFPELIQVHKK